jgi:hypothetical protein
MSADRPECTEDAVEDLGHGVRAQRRYIDGQLDCVAWWHACDGTDREDGLPVKPSWATGWTVESIRPLTLSPSLLCRLCKFHGFVREGKWVPC